jgi:hypothetical protein
MPGAGQAAPWFRVPLSRLDSVFGKRHALAAVSTNGESAGGFLFHGTSVITVGTSPFATLGGGTVRVRVGPSGRLFALVVTSETGAGARKVTRAFEPRAALQGYATGNRSLSVPILGCPGPSRRVVASWVPGMAVRQPAQPLGQSSDWPILSDRFDHVTATARLEPARRSQERAESDLVQTDRRDKESAKRAGRQPPNSLQRIKDEG